MMTQDEIIRVAQEAGFVIWSDTSRKGMVDWACEYDTELERFAALVAEPWIETNKALANEIIELKKQAEQSQLADASLEPVAWFVQYKNRHEFVFGSKPEFIVDGVVEPLYAAPVSIAKQSETDSSSFLMQTTVRTKDLTDEELNDLWHNTKGGWLGLFRAVIAADREKNK